MTQQYLGSSQGQLESKKKLALSRGRFDQEASLKLHAENRAEMSRVRMRGDNSKSLGWVPGFENLSRLLTNLHPVCSSPTASNCFCSPRLFSHSTSRIARQQEGQEPFFICAYNDIMRSVYNGCFSCTALPNHFLPRSSYSTDSTAWFSASWRWVHRSSGLPPCPRAWLSLFWQIWCSWSASKLPRFLLEIGMTMPYHAKYCKNVLYDKWVPSCWYDCSCFEVRGTSASYQAKATNAASNKGWDTAFGCEPCHTTSCHLGLCL